MGLGSCARTGSRAPPNAADLMANHEVYQAAVCGSDATAKLVALIRDDSDTVPPGLREVC